MAVSATERQQKHYTGLRTSTERYHALQRHVVMAGMYDRQSAYRKGIRWLETEPLPVDLSECAGKCGPGLETMERLWADAKRRAPGGLISRDLYALEDLVEAKYQVLALGHALPEEDGDPSAATWLRAREFWRKREATARKYLDSIESIPLELLVPESALEGKPGDRMSRGAKAQGVSDLAHNC